MCIDLLTTDITGPLAAFQGRSLGQDGVRRLVQDLNEATEKKMAKDRLDVVFKNMSPDLEAALTEAIKRVPATQEPQRSVPDMLAELVERARRTERSVDELTSGVPLLRRRLSVRSVEPATEPKPYCSTWQGRDPILTRHGFRPSVRAVQRQFEEAAESQDEEPNP